MYLFKIFEVFPSDYWNGFADGTTFVSVVYALRALCVFKRTAARFRFSYCIALRNIREGTMTADDLDRLHDAIESNWQLTASEKIKMASLLVPIRKFIRQPFQSRQPEKLQALSELEKMADHGNLSASARFRKCPVDSILLALINAAWFGKE